MIDDVVPLRKEEKIDSILTTGNTFKRTEVYSKIIMLMT